LVAHKFILSLFSHNRLSKKPLLFKSFTGLTAVEFDNSYNKEITTRYDRHEIQRYLSKEKIEKGTHVPEDHSIWI
jgi:hypothetical protein